MKRIILTIGFILCASIAHGQVINPTAVDFNPSADHATVTKYVIGYFAQGASLPTQTADLPLKPPDANNLLTYPIVTTPLSFGIYTAKVKAVAGTIEGEWSADSNPFARAPLPPPLPTVKK